MCGIVGFKLFKTLPQTEVKESLELMTQTIEHRGPDDLGHEYFKNQSEHPVAMGFRRLSILDLSSDGHQPMQYGALTLTFNGEIYNYKTIKKELESSGYTFLSQTDSEVILKGFHKWGVDIFSKLNGMFAIAIYNSESDELVLARDRMGIKPLSYYFGNDGIIYSSEIKAIPISKLPKLTLNKRVIIQYLNHGYVNQPASIYNEIHKLPPGHYLTLKGSKIEVKSYWKIPNQSSKYIKEDETLNKFDELVNSAVNLRMIADVPLGSFLSGGYDSSLVSAVMQSQHDQKIDTFSIGFNDPAYDESKYAEAVAKHIGSNHHKFEVTSDDAKSVLSNVYKTLDEPFADSSLIPTFLLSKLTKSKVTVALSGDGGDELFHGYRSYLASQHLKKFESLSKGLQPLNSIFNLNKALYKIKPRFAKYPLLNSNQNIINHNYISSINILEDILIDTPFSLDQSFLNINNDNNIANEHSLLDLRTYLPNDILMKVDKASMLNSLEARTPLLDHRIVEFSQQVDPSLKIKEGQGKYILKRLTHKYIPKSIMERPKMGFAIPIFKWLHSDLSFYLKNI